MVLQRSLTNVMGPWQNVYTNRVTAENPYGSINFVDREAKGKNAFYRAVGTEKARKASLESQTETITPAR